MSKYIKQNEERFCRSLDYTAVAGKTNPYALLAAAVIAQAAVDCSEYDPDIEMPYSIEVQRKGVNCRVGNPKSRPSASARIWRDGWKGDCND